MSVCVSVSLGEDVKVFVLKAARAHVENKLCDVSVQHRPRGVRGR